MVCGRILGILDDPEEGITTGLCDECLEEIRRKRISKKESDRGGSNALV